jgi:phosphatidylglycerophosphatase A
MAGAAAPLWYLALMCVVPVLLFIAALPVCARISQWEDGEDPQIIVIDEFIGQWLCLLLLPHELVVHQPIWVLAGFLLFRAFDIFKPLLIRRVEKIGGGFGILADDILAGLYAGAILLGLRLLLT